LFFCASGHLFLARLFPFPSSTFPNLLLSSPSPCSLLSLSHHFSDSIPINLSFLFFFSCLARFAPNLILLSRCPTPTLSPSPQLPPFVPFSAFRDCSFVTFFSYNVSGRHVHFTFYRITMLPPADVSTVSFPFPNSFSHSFFSPFHTPFPIRARFLPSPSNALSFFFLFLLHPTLQSVNFPLPFFFPVCSL